MQHSTYMPHGICYLWEPGLVWLHVVSDAVIALAYFAIPPTLLYLLWRARREVRSLGAPYPARGLPYEWIYLAFGLFIVACGTTHLVGVWTVWNPDYWLSGGVKAVTALASVATAVVLPPMVPRITAMYREARLSEMQRSQLAQLAAVVEQSDDAILTQSLDAVVLTWNRGAERLYGYTAEEMIGQSTDAILPEDGKAELRELLARIAAGESVVHQETVRVRRDGTLVDISLTVSPVRGPDGTVVAASAIGRDIGPRKRAHEREVRLAEEQAARAEAERLAERYAAIAAEQKRLYEEAAAISRTKSEFLAVMSHELRTPLNGILGYAELLDAEVFGALNERQREQLRRIRRSSDHLRRIIEQVLDHAKLEAGKVEPDWSRLRLRPLVTDAAQLVQPAAAEKGLELTWDVDESIEIESDATYVKQILLNLLSNAVKFTAAGNVELTAAAGADGFAEIVVRDTGRGIAPEDLEQIFEPFWQADQGRSRSAEGTGLGLTVARRLAEVLRGSLTVTSSPGAGTTATLRLPLHGG